MASRRCVADSGKKPRWIERPEPMKIKNLRRGIQRPFSFIMSVIWQDLHPKLDCVL